jgi:hypothetical protein
VPETPVGLELTVGGVLASNIDEEDEITALGGLDGEFGFIGVISNNSTA